MNYDNKLLSRLRLFGTDGCHLCYEAMVLCEQVLAYLPTEIEITDFDENLYQQYELRIPVLVYLPDAGTSDAVDLSHELPWPFSAETLHAFLQKLSR